MVQAGIEHSVVRRFGRWVTDTYMDYLWEAFEQMKGVSAKMASAKFQLTAPLQPGVPRKKVQFRASEDLIEPGPLTCSDVAWRRQAVSSLAGPPPSRAGEEPPSQPTWRDLARQNPVGSPILKPLRVAPTHAGELPTREAFRAGGGPSGRGWWSTSSQEWSRHADRWEPSNRASTWWSSAAWSGHPEPWTGSLR